MKIVKIFGVVMAVHAAVFMFVFAIPGCRSTSKKPAASATATGGPDVSPLSPADTTSPVVAPAPAGETAAVRFSPTRPGTATAAEVTAPPPPATYTVAKGDNLWIIAKKNGVSVKQLTAANNLRTDSTLKLGQKLVIPGKTSEAAPAVAPAATSMAAPAAVAAPAAAHTTTTVTHVIKAGETLGTIAKKYQVKVGDIATANNIADPTKIRVGQTLKIPTKSAPAAATTKAATTKSATTTKPATTVKAAPAAPAVAPAATAPAAPIFTSPVIESAPAPAGGSPVITPAPESTEGAPVIRVEESGAPKIE